jgi:hypothetical protein
MESRPTERRFEKTNKLKKSEFDAIVGLIPAQVFIHDE